MAKYIQPLDGLAVTKAKAATLPAPSATTDGCVIGGSLAGAKTFSPRSGAGYPTCLLTIFADGAATLTNAILWGLEPLSGLWGPFVSAIPSNSALPASITLSATQAFHVEINLPTVFTSIALVGSVSANNVGYTVYPVSDIF